MAKAGSHVVRALSRDPRILERFWSHVNRGEAEQECWQWTGRCSHPGYPSFQIGQRSVIPAHIAWFSTTGQLPYGGRVHRLCDNTLCVRPSHLVWVVGRVTEERLLAESAGYLLLAGVSRAVEERRPGWPRFVRVTNDR